MEGPPRRLPRRIHGAGPARVRLSRPARGRRAFRPVRGPQQLVSAYPRRPECARHRSGRAVASASRDAGRRGVAGRGRPDVGLDRRVDKDRLRSELLGEIGHGAVLREQPGVIGFRYVHAELLVQGDHDVEEVHRIQLELIAKPHVGLDVAKVFIRRDVRDDLEHHLLAFVFCHGRFGAN